MKIRKQIGSANSKLPLEFGKRPFIFYFIAILFSIIQVSAQSNSSLSPARSTTGVAGSSERITINSREYIIQQSFGQASSIGTFEVNQYIARQGFIQPNVFAKIADKNVEFNLEAVVYPNPFSEYVTISFNEQINGVVGIYLYDLSGNLLRKDEYEYMNSIQMSFWEIPNGQYFLKIRYKDGQLIKRIIKK